MQAAFDSFARSREDFRVSAAAWDIVTDHISRCAEEDDREDYMLLTLCELFLKSGTKVMLEEVEDRPELNGLYADVVGKCEDGYFPVHVAEIDEHCSVSVRSLRPAGFDSRPQPDFKIRAVADEGGATGFIYTVGLSGLGGSVMYPMLTEFGREMFVRDVESVAKLMNFLVSRMEEGVPVNDEQLVQSNGLMMASQLHTAETAAEMRAEYHLEQPEGSELIELHPVVSCEGNDDMWGRILTQADARAMAAQAGL
ncbi:hypothetical protein EMIHUDRAFT_468553 [Emiliania huxleyi CCMP1516]|uniref:Uncharacterized protein n=2 Tax=Emiliania huxleyi TaxID=2903 RepID=A0A0D3K110_EMIH1|nr:hypothetical protein EMIHUDRAFT_468553 [Emiliania huxleyi CCMP1516]EOD29445.1 hypothetical protein EMIHUDRAFT_468553 [Emiliania huxleyi CCMP1516]|eukprot:XP_005781874.1 hypothetical protein EMIHUDRAFT_468553 [Emiliania huxleyi CCMP1516]